MARFETQRFILAKSDGTNLQFLSFFGTTPKKAWETCEEVYGVLKMHKLQDEGYKAIPFKLEVEV